MLIQFNVAPHQVYYNKFLGLKVDEKEDKGNSIQSSNLNPLGRDLRFSQITLRIVKYLYTI